MPKRTILKEYRSDICIEASDFACELLMPEKDFRQAIRSGFNTIEKLCIKFQLTYSAVSYRAWMLGIIKEIQC